RFVKSKRLTLVARVNFRQCRREIRVRSRVVGQLGSGCSGQVAIEGTSAAEKLNSGASLVGATVVGVIDVDTIVGDGGRHTSKAVGSIGSVCRTNLVLIRIPFAAIPLQCRASEYVHCFHVTNF